MGLALDEPGENEATVNINGIEVLIADQVKPFADDKKLDYIDSAQGKGFILGSGSGQSCC